MNVLNRLTTCLVLFVCLSSHLSAGQEDDRLQNLMESYWGAYSRLSPLMATAFGDNRFNAYVDDLSDNAFKARIHHLDKAIEVLGEIDVRRLSTTNQVNYKVFDWMVTHERERLDYSWHYITTALAFGWHTFFAQVVNTTTFDNEGDYQDYLKRLQQFGRYADQNMALMQKGIETGYVKPCEVLAGYEDTINNYITATPKQSTYYKPFSHLPDKYSEKVITDLQTRAQKVIADVVVPAYQRHLYFFTHTYKPACRDSIGLSDIPKGRELYDHFVRYYTTLDTNAETAHALGLSEVKRIRAEMDRLINAVGFKGNFKSFVTFLRKDPQFYPKNAESYLARASTIAKRIDSKLPEYFSYLQRNTYGILPIDETLAPEGPVGYAQAGAADGTRAGQFRLNTYNLKSRPLYGLTSLTLHEAVPGHLLQGAIQREMENLPQFRRYYFFTAFNEGWALYSERLGEEMGIYNTPYDKFGRLVYEMWRACRLVVDTGIHAEGWTRQQAIDFMMANTALSSHNITTEVDRYIRMPGQALAYKYGELKIRELRKRAEKALGAQFSLRDFHSMVLTSGSLPLTVLEEITNHWIAANKCQTQMDVKPNTRIECMSEEE